MVVRQSIDVGYFRCVNLGDCFANGILPVGSSRGQLFSGEESYDGGLSLVVLVSGVLIIPVLFFGLTQAIFSFPGISFKLIAWLFGLFVFVIIPLGRWLIKWLLPEEDLRLELFFLTNALVAILGIIATVNGRTAVEGVGDVDWSALTGCVVLFLVGAVAGWIISVIKRN